MKSLMLIVADHASVESNTGKLNILGAFRRITAHQFPARHPAMSLVLKLGGDIGDSPNPHRLSVSLVDADGRKLFEISGAFNMPRGETGLPSEFNAVMEFRDIVFVNPGVYSFYVEVDAEVIDQTDIEIVQLIAQARE